MTTENQTELTEEQEAHAAQLSAEFSTHESNGQPAIENPATEKPVKEEMTSTGLAAIGVNALSHLITAAYPCVAEVFSVEIKSEAVARFSPLLDKYQVKSEFFEKWRLELEAIQFCAGVGFSMYKLIEADKAAKAKEVENVTQD